MLNNIYFLVCSKICGSLNIESNKLTYSEYNQSKNGESDDDNDMVNVPEDEFDESIDQLQTTSVMTKAMIYPSVLLLNIVSIFKFTKFPSFSYRGYQHQRHLICHVI